MLNTNLAFKLHNLCWLTKYVEKSKTLSKNKGYCQKLLYQQKNIKCLDKFNLIVRALNPS